MTTLTGRRIVSGLLAMGLTAAAGAAAVAQTPTPAPDPAAGSALADRLCASCHIVRPGQSGTTTPGIPSFAAIANRPNQSRTNIVQILIAPHGEMPDVSLTRTEIGNLLSYIDSLRDKSLPSLLPETGPDVVKPQYPQPS